MEKNQAAKIGENEINEARFNMDELLWKDEILVFNDSNIKSISSRIQRWFNVEVTVNNESAIANNFSGTYSNESLEEILIGMGYALNFSFEINENQIIITGLKK